MIRGAFAAAIVAALAISPPPGGVRKITAGTTEPRVAEAPLLGSKLEKSAFRYSRVLSNSSAGVGLLALDADVVAHSRGMADLRIIDAQSRQVPFVFEEHSKPLRLTLRVPARVEKGGTSTYRLDLPYDTFHALVTIELETSARVFERNVRLIAAENETRGREPRELARTLWRNTSDAAAAPVLEFATTLSETPYLEVVIDDGDNAPLPLTSARLLLPAWALRFRDPGTRLWLIYGNPAAQSPRYDLALLATELSSVTSHAVSLGPVTRKNGDSAIAQRSYFWIAIGAVVAILIALLARLLRTPGPEESRPLG